ncbi:copper transporter [Desulfofundulus salinus]|uniref:Copper transporter n=1 Tax=Desulfofundulus salinus TaxID=2419843 RepID=A0A494X1R1_9FIRM|nr:copper transporter [Desulfofundulus salinum]
MMIINLRYHIASLVAVFLALGLGILVGSTMLGNDALTKQQKQLADKLMVQMEQLREKNEAVEARANALEMDNQKQKQFEKQVLPVLVRDRLTGYRLAIIETNSYGFPDDLIATLRLAGAEVESITTVLNGFYINGQDQTLQRQLGWSNLTNEQLTTRLAGEIARGLVKGKSKVLDVLVEENLIKITGNYGVPLDGVIIIGGSQDRDMVRVQTLDLPLIDTLLQYKIPVYGVEETNVLYSYMPDYQKKRITTVDNIDTIPGQVALVIALTGKPGHYGVKPTAQKLLPEMDEGGKPADGKRTGSIGTGSRL